MISTLARMRVTTWRRTPNGLRWIGIPLGILLALITVGAAASPGDTGNIAIVLALIYAVWLTGWMVGPIQSGGAELLRPEWFATHPIPPRRLAFGLLAAGFVGIGAAITLIASVGLVVFGSRYGAGAVVVGVVAALLMVLLMMTVSRLVAETLSASAKSRIVLEITSIQWGLFIAVMFVGWFAISQLMDVAGRVGADIGDVLPPVLRTVLLVLPSGWGVVAVRAAGEGDWIVSGAALAGLGLLIWLGLVRWGHMLERRMTEPGAGGLGRTFANGRNFLPATPLGAVAAKDMRTWSRDPRRGVEVRSTLWSALFIAAAAWAFAPDLLAFSGVVVVLIGAMACVNVYAMDGTALWYTLLTPGAVRSDVRGRQLAWLLIFIPAAVIPSLAGIAIAPEAWAIPWVLSLLPAMLGGGAGLIVWLSVVGLVPETDAHKRSGNPAETGADATAIYFIMPLRSVVSGRTRCRGNRPQCDQGEPRPGLAGRGCRRPDRSGVCVGFRGPRHPAPGGQRARTPSEDEGGAPGPEEDNHWRCRHRRR